MIIGLLQLEAMLSGHSLKEKRQVVRSFKERIRKHFNVAIAETAHVDKWQRTEISMVTLGMDRSVIEKTLEKIRNLADSHSGWVVNKWHRDFY
jgi:uncharacterized protein YlxP (DUF503 family)